MAATRRAVALISGGLDSTTVLAIARADGYELCGVTFDYGQRHVVELAAARAAATAWGVADHRVVRLDPAAFARSALTGQGEVPTGRSDDTIADGIPVTYVPARNTVFLAYALAIAEDIGAADIFVGVNAVDYSGYPDCRPEFVAAFETMANLATKAAVEGLRLTVHAPLIKLTKAEIIARGTALGVDYSQTHSCYAPAPGGAACGGCDSCILRARGFADAGIPDPTRYQS
jgi:7-cyano-7-deazaguanine synthase